MYQGFVRKINTKSGTGKRGVWTLYSMIVQKEDGVESPWISIGFDAPKFKEHDFIAFETETTARGENLIVKSVTFPPTPKAAVVATPSGTTTVAPSTGAVSRDASIQYQSSRKDALQLVQLLLAHDALPMSTSTAKAGQAKRFEEIKAFVDKMTVEYYGDVQTGRVLQSVVDAGAVKPAASGGASADADQEDND